MKSLLTFGLCAVVFSVLTVPAQAGLVAPDVSVAGISQGEWSARWWQWAASYPNGSNPVQDTTGAFSSAGNQGPVFFLAGSFGSDPVTRSVTVGSDQYLFLPLANAVSVAPFFGNTEAELRQDASDTLGVVSNLSITLNGSAVALPPPTTSLVDFRQLSPPGLFDLTLPTDNVFGAPDGTYPAVSDGYWVMLAPLPQGSYQLHFTSESMGTGIYDGDVLTQDITYNISSVPEPSGLLLLISGLVGTGMAGIKRIRSRGNVISAVCHLRFPRAVP